jgi:hypothetical protein
MSDIYRIGLDLGTKTIVCATREADGRPKFRQEINGFFVFPKKDAFTKNMLVQQKIPYVERDGNFIALGSRAEKFAYAINSTLRRPMAEGTISHENEAISIMASIAHALIGRLDGDAILYYCVPADALNKKTNVQFHQKVAQLIFESYKRTDVKINAYSINEARAIAIGSKESLAIAISWGAGMVNTCYTMYGVPIFEFSLVGSGDWIDLMAAKQFGYDPDSPSLKSQETPTSICHKKHTIDLTMAVDGADRVDQAILLHYQLLIENVIAGIINGFESNTDKARIEEPVPIIMAGGTSSPTGFKEYFEQILSKYKLPFEVSAISVVDKPLYAVAEGCLMAAEMHEV